jgi:hypothetical protein
VTRTQTGRSAAPARSTVCRQCDPPTPIDLGNTIDAQPAIEAATLEGDSIAGERGEVHATRNDIRLQLQFTVAGAVEPEVDAGIELEQVAYRGGGAAINDLIGGHVKLGSLGSTPLMPHYKAGALRLLAQTTAARSQSLPDVPTFEEAGFKGLVLDQWLGVFVPAGTPAAIVARLNADIGKALAEPAIRANLVQSAQEPVGGTAEAFGVRVREDFEKYRRLVQELNIKVAR